MSGALTAKPLDVVLKSRIILPDLWSPGEGRNGNFTAFLGRNLVKKLKRTATLSGPEMPGFQPKHPNPVHAKV
jgi:hypothetical protein